MSFQMGGSPPRFHSALRATIGSTFAALRAGIQQASNATISCRIAITVNVSGSVALTPKSKPCSNRVSAKAVSKPRPMPITINLMPCHKTSLRIALVCAPSASRMPISCVRSVTLPASTP